jgi:putative DNA primase/helicase
MDNSMKITQQVQNRAKKTQADIEKKSAAKKRNLIDEPVILKSLDNNELGDGYIFILLFRNDLVFNKAMDCWMSWAGHHWVVDKMNWAEASVVSVAEIYKELAKSYSTDLKNLNKKLEAGMDVDEKAFKQKKKLIDKLNGRASQLKSVRRRKNCLIWAHSQKGGLAIEGSEIDQKPWLLPCANGVINLKSGELDPGRQEDYLLKASPVAFPDDGINANFDMWENTLLEIFSDNQKLVDFLRQICGYALVGEVSESILVVMSGRGRNGKSMIVETISKVLGRLSGAIRSEMLLNQNRVANSAGSTPDIMALRGLRMAFASETDDGCKISPSRVKWLTGNDTITGRNPHDKYEVLFKPSHTLFLLTNHKPKAPADDFAFWERMVLFPFELSFVDREPKTENEFRSDPQLGKKLEAVLPNILAWMVRGCLEWQQAGRLIHPRAVKEAVSDYHSDSDSIIEFLDECCELNDKYRVKFSTLFTCFETWWSESVSRNVPKKRWFSKQLVTRFQKEKIGVYWYHGLQLAPHITNQGGK